MKSRIEKDSLGKKKVPYDRYFGIHTQRSIETFQVSKKRINFELFLTITEIKIAAAKTNMELGLLNKKIGNAIIKACKEILNGKLNREFVVDIFQAGAGTSTHMNVNEVIANRAIEILKGKKGDYRLVHPNDHVNMGQSTNDVFPSAIRISTYFKLISLINNLNLLNKELLKKSNEFKAVLKSGRTHLQDAVPMTLGQEFHAYAYMVEKDIQRIKKTMDFLIKLNIGGNAIGTGINTNVKFKKKIIINLRMINKVNWKSSEDYISDTQSVTDFLDVSEMLKIIAIDLIKIANDFRLLSSGPITGLKEIKLPAIEPGSSIMPGKINPSIAEMMNMICFQVIGNNEAISYSAQAGQLELNVMMPLIAHDLLDSLDILNNGIKIFINKCIIGIKVNKEVCKYYFEHSMGLATLLNPYIGYDKASWVVKESLKTGKSISGVVLEKRLLTKDKLDEIFNIKKIAGTNSNL